MSLTRGIWAALAHTPASLLAGSALAWSVLLGSAHLLLEPALCFSAGSAAARWLPQPFSLFLNGSYRLVLWWLLMLTAMMLPLLETPVAHIRAQSLARRRNELVLVFCASYFAAWLVAGLPLLLLAKQLTTLAGTAGVHPWCFGVPLAWIWLASLPGAACHRQCHHVPRLPFAGLAASAASARYGVRYAWYCIGSCWPFMLLPLLTSDWHLPAMALATLAAILHRKLDLAAMIRSQAACRVQEKLKIF